MASNLEKKSQENARKMSSLVGMAGKLKRRAGRKIGFSAFFLGSTMTQIGVGIGVNKSPIKQPMRRESCKTETKKNPNDGTQMNLNYKALNKQISNNSSDRRLTNDNIDDENSNSFESHSDAEGNANNEKKSHSMTEKLTTSIRRGMSVNWGNHPVTTLHATNANRNSQHQRGLGSRPMSNMRSLAHSIYRNPIRLNGISSSGKSKPSNKANPSHGSPQIPSALTPIESEAELSTTRVYSLPPQPRPETLAIMSDEVFHERLKARHSPLLTLNETSVASPSSSTVVPTEPTVTSNTPMNEPMVEEEKPNSTPSSSPLSSEKTGKTDETVKNIVDLSVEVKSTSSVPHSPLSVKQILNNLDQASNDGWFLWGSETGLDIPFIDETDFEDLGK